MAKMIPDDFNPLPGAGGSPMTADALMAMIASVTKEMGIPSELLNQLAGEEPTYELIDGEVIEKGKRKVARAGAVKYMLNIGGKEVELTLAEIKEAIDKQAKNPKLLTQMDLDNLFKKQLKASVGFDPGIPEDPNELVPMTDADGETIMVPRSVKMAAENKTAKLDAWWQPVGKPKMKISQMKTSHLFNSLRLIYNKLVPANLRIDVKDAANFKASVPDDQSKHILNVMFYQIGLRDNLTDEQFEKLAKMAKVVRETL